jgi:NADPH-dependent ferric siderophore reductase
MSDNPQQPDPQRPVPQRGRRHRPPPRVVEVVAVEPLTPRWVAIHFSGDELKDFPAPPPTAHIKVQLPDEDGQLLRPEPGPDGPGWPDGKRPLMRTYTPRRYLADTNTLEVQFLRHGHGPASTFAQRAKVGDRAGIGGPGGRFAVDETIGHWWIGGDETALPAIATLLEALPAHATAEIHLEIGDQDDRLPLPEHEGAEVSWHVRRPDVWGAELLDAAASATISAGDGIWTACEATAVRQLRAHFLTERGLAKDLVTTRGYWRAGEANHPDHDYGED